MYEMTVIAVVLPKK